MEWISVKDRLPERYRYANGTLVGISGSVLVTDGSNFFKCNYVHDKNAWQFDGITLANITHWCVPLAPHVKPVDKLAEAKSKLINIHSGSHIKDLKEVLMLLMAHLENKK